MCRADSRLVPSQWETLLQSNTISHWLGTNLESAARSDMVSLFRVFHSKLTNHKKKSWPYQCLPWNLPCSHWSPWKPGMQVHMPVMGLHSPLLRQEHCSRHPWPYVPAGHTEREENMYGSMHRDINKMVVIWQTAFLDAFSCYYRNDKIFHGVRLKQLILVWWCHMATKVCVNISSGSGLLPDGTKWLPEPMVTCYERYCVAFTWEKFHKKCSWA